MTDRWAIIDQASGKVVNTIAWGGEGGADVIPPGHTAVESDAAGIGDSYADGVFTRQPEPVEVLAPKSDSVVSDAEQQLKPAVDALVAAGILTPERAAQILAS